MSSLLSKVSVHRILQARMFFVYDLFKKKSRFGTIALS